MRILHPTKSLLTILITAFLLLQWSATHIHLAGEHEHDGGVHQHAATAHQHQLSSHHVDAIDVATDSLSHSDTSKVIELDHVCTQLHGKFDGHCEPLQSSTWAHVSRHDTYCYNTLTHEPDANQAYHQYTTVRLRAPPATS